MRERALAEINTDFEAQLSQQRALTSLFSVEAFEEVRALFWDRQRAGRARVVESSKADLLFNLMWGAGRDRESLASTAVQVAANFIFSYVLGTIVSLADTLVRLPWYIREYELFEANEAHYHDAVTLLHERSFPMLPATATGHSDASPSTDEADAGGDIALHDEAFPAAMISAPLTPRFFQGGFIGAVKGLVFYAVVATGLTLVTVVIALSPVLVVGLVVVAGYFFLRKGDSE